MKRVVLVRIAPGEDILQGLRKAVADHGIRNGLFLTGLARRAIRTSTWG